MPSLPGLYASGMPLLPLLSLLLALEGVGGVRGASLREHRFRNSESDSLRPNDRSVVRPYPAPSVEMLRALEYIQNLRKQTSATPVRQPLTNDAQPAVPQNDLDDLGSVRSMLRLATPARSLSDEDRDRAEEERQEERHNREEDHSQQWLQAVLTTLQQTEEQPLTQNLPQTGTYQGLNRPTSPSKQRYPIAPASRPRQPEEETDRYVLNPWTEQGRGRHRKYPLMFEDDSDGQVQPLKRTNENAEEQYTPQKLATLQSVFEELSRVSGSKDSSKREVLGDEDDEDDGTYRAREVAFDNMVRSQGWIPLEEQIETEEEEREREEVNRGLDDEEEEDGEEDEEEDDSDNEAKRSSQSDVFETDQDEEPEDISQLVDYYLLKVLEKTEQEQKREEEETEQEEEERALADEEGGEEEEERDEEERNEERRDAHPQFNFDPNSLYQLLQISQKLQIPPEDLLDLLQQEEPKEVAKLRSRPLALPISPKSHKTPHTPLNASPSQRQSLETPASSDLTAAITTQDILSLLGLSSTGPQNANTPQGSVQLRSRPALAYSSPRSAKTDYAFPETDRDASDRRQDDYDDTLGEEELASYLAVKMLAPRQQRRARLASPAEAEEEREADKLLLGTLEQAMQDYLDQTDESSPQRRGTEPRDTDASLDNDTLLRILGYLELESPGAGEKDITGKTVVPGM